jgi:hypothetical protein
MLSLRGHCVALAALAVTQAQAEIVTPKYWPQTDLASYSCTDTVSSFVNRVCYDAATRHMLILLNVTYYPYCDIDADTVKALLVAPSKGRFYNASIKGRFDCRRSPASGTTQ